MTFEKWWKEAMENRPAVEIVPAEVGYLEKTYARASWDYQQKEIDILHEIIQHLENKRYKTKKDLLNALENLDKIEESK